MTWNDKTQAQTDGRAGCRYLGDGQKGLYVCAIGGLPLFASGTRIESECTAQQLVFSEPCDPEHITLVSEENNSSSSSSNSGSSGGGSSSGTNEQKFKCTRSDTPLGTVHTVTGGGNAGGEGGDGNGSNKKYVISDLRSLRYVMTAVVR